MYRDIDTKCEQCKHNNKRFTCNECTAYSLFEEEIKIVEKVNHPSHYNKGIEVIDYIESHNMNFNLGNAIKYISRCEHKDNKKVDIEKAIWYLQREIGRGE